MFLTAADIMKILGVGKTTAYNIIIKLNQELSQMGYNTQRGRVNTAFFNKKYCYKEN